MDGREVRGFLLDAEDFVREEKPEHPAVPEWWAEEFEEQRKNIGMCYALSNTIRRASHMGAAALLRGDMDTVDACRNMAKQAWDHLGKVNIPEDMRWSFDGEAGQELVELELAVQLFPALEGVSPWTPKLATAKELNVRPQTWLAGFGDAITEVSKIHLERMGDPKLNREERITLRRNNLALVKMGYAVLKQFETVYPVVINNNRRRGFFNTYRGLIMRIERLIERELEALAAILDRDAT